MTDIPAIVALQARSWRSAYRGIVDDAFLDAIPMQHWMESWRALFFTPYARCFVAEQDDRLVGFASVGKPEFVEDVGPSVAELHTIYIDASLYGRGVGQLLMTTCLDHLRQQGFTEVILWVIEDNARGRRFYERGGWKLDGTRAADCWGATSVPRVRYRLALPV